MVMQGFNSSIWDDFLNTDELGQRTAFYGSIPQGFNNFQQRQAQNLFEPVFNRYLGQLGQQIFGKQTPNRSFKDYLTQDFNFERELMRLPQQQNTLTAPSRFVFGR